MPRPSNTEARRRQIAAALQRVMARKGYDGATVAEVAREAGLAPGLVHYHFESKREILLELLDRLVEEHQVRVEARLSKARDERRARLHAFIDAHLATGKDADPAALGCWVTILAEALREPEVARRVAAAMRDLQGRLERILDDLSEGPPRDVDARSAAAALFAAIQGYYVVAATSRRLIPRGSAARATRLMAEGLLTGRTRRRRSS